MPSNELLLSSLYTWIPIKAIGLIPSFFLFFPLLFLYGGRRQRGCLLLDLLGHESRPHLPLERPKRPDKNLQALCRLTQLTKEELKKFYRAFKQVRVLNVECNFISYSVLVHLIFSYSFLFFSFTFVQIK